jgi:CheY-like chemotaxis protein
MSRVLLADDDAGFRDALQTLLGEAGHSVRVVGNGLEALSAALDETPDVIVSDIHMPVLDGPDAISMLRAIPRFADIAVILMSGQAVSESVPTERFLHKPFEPSVLLDMLARVALCEQAAIQCARADKAAGRDDCAATPDQTAMLQRRIAVALTLLAEQEKRVARLQRCGVDAALAIQLCEALAGSVAALMGYEKEVKSPDA